MIRLELKRLPVSGAVGSTANFPVQQAAKWGVLEIV